MIYRIDKNQKYHNKNWNALMCDIMYAYQTIKLFELWNLSNISKIYWFS